MVAQQTPRSKESKAQLGSRKVTKRQALLQKLVTVSHWPSEGMGVMNSHGSLMVTAAFSAAALSTVHHQHHSDSHHVDFAPAKEYAKM